MRPGLGATSRIFSLGGEVLDRGGSVSGLEVCIEAAGAHLLYGVATLRRSTLEGVEDVARAARPSCCGVYPNEEHLRQDVEAVEGLYRAVALTDNNGVLARLSAQPAQRISKPHSGVFPCWPLPSRAAHLPGARGPPLLAPASPFR